MRHRVEGAAKSLHLPRLYAIQTIPAGVSVEGDFYQSTTESPSSDAFYVTLWPLCEMAKTYAGIAIFWENSKNGMPKLLFGCI